jgi:hypothetical protein
VARGYLGSYPNFAFDVDVDEVETFTTALSAVQTPADFEAVAARWGLRAASRNSEPHSIGCTTTSAAASRSSSFDLNRYENR